MKYFPDMSYITSDNILNPTSFVLLIKRNLSSQWYKDHPQMEISGRLQAIEVKI